MRQGLVCMLAAAAVAVSSTGFAQGRPGATACTTLMCDVQADFERTRNTITTAANAMPDDKFGFKPTPAQQTFAERVMHIATTDVALFGTLGAKAPAPMLNAKAATKAEVMAELQKSYDYQAAALKEFNDAQLTERVKSLPFMGPTVSRLRLIYFDFGHSQDIYGQMAVYLRLSGVTPPASNRGGV
jgi:uncharacterized damage-inducible protein DinB